MQSIYKGVRIIDVTKVFSGPFATRMFADYGAEVVKIEHAEYPDDSRLYPPTVKGWSGYYEILNRNKKGIALNLKDEKEREKLYQLCQDADIFVENLTPSTKYKLKIDYETLKQYNPKLIYASLSGTGQTSDRKYYDIIAQAESGLLSLCGLPEIPMKIGPSVVDAFSGMTLAFALASALYYRSQTGKGQYVDVAMLGCAMNLLESNLINYSIQKVNPVRTGNLDNTISPFGVYKGKDGYVVIAIGNNTLWEKFVVFLEEHSVFDKNLFETNELRLRHNDVLQKVIENALQQFPVAQIVETLHDRGIPCTPIQTMEDVFNNQEIYKLGFLEKIQHPKLGTCVVPGSSITFSEEKKEKNSYAPQIGEDNKVYEV